MTTCIVSAYYKIPSKRSHEIYMPNIIRFFESVKSVSVIFFTTPDVIQDIRDSTNTDHVMFVCIPFEELRAFEKFGIDFWVRQKERDPETYHSYQLGAIWYEKKEFVLRAMEFIKADVYMWCDAGCVRDIASGERAKLFGTRTVYPTNNNKLHLQQIGNNIKSDFYMYPYMCIAGAIIVGNIQAWKEYSELYDSVLIRYDSHNVPAIMDQYIIKSCVDLKPELFVLYPQLSTIDNWFKFLEFM
jgi:disulfide oxidoreductase YuzD